MRVISILLLAVLLTMSSAVGQTIQQPRKVKVFGDTAAADTLDIYGLLNGNAPGDFPTSGVPYAVVVGKGGKFVVGAGGFIKAVAGWDFGHPIASADEFITSQIPMRPMEGDGSRFNLSARQSELYVNFVALPGQKDQIGAFVGVNFLDDGYMPVVQYAYLKWRGLKAGYDNTLFSDPACGPPTVDYEGPCSNTCSPNAVVSYTYDFGPWTVAAGAELPQASFTIVEGKTKEVTQRVPDIPIAVKYSWDSGNSWVRGSAILRALTYRDMVISRNYSCAGYGFQVSGVETFLNRFTLYYQGVWGKGIGSMLQDTQGEGLDMVPVGEEARLKPVMLWGGFVGLRCDICDRLAMSATYSQERTYADAFEGGATERGNLYRYAQYVSANIFFSATEFLEVGLENIWGRRVNYDGMKCGDDRLQCSLQFTF